MFNDSRTIENSRTCPVDVVFEPWGMPLRLEPGQKFQLVAQSNSPGSLEIEDRPDSVTVYGWPGSTLQVFDGEQLVQDFSTRFPDVPAGYSVRQFTDLMFGGQSGSAQDHRRPEGQPAFQSFLRASFLKICLSPISLFLVGLHAVIIGLWYALFFTGEPTAEVPVWKFVFVIDFIPLFAFDRIVEDHSGTIQRYIIVMGLLGSIQWWCIGSAFAAWFAWLDWRDSKRVALVVKKAMPPPGDADP